MSGTSGSDSSGSGGSSQSATGTGGRGRAVFGGMVGGPLAMAVLSGALLWMWRI